MSQRRLLITNSIATGLRACGSMAIGLVITPILLHNFGEELFGFAVTVGASGPLLAMVSQTLGLSISRELTFWVGADDALRLRQAFSSACLLQFFSGGLICLVGFVASSWAVSFLTVPDGYHRSAVIALRLTALDYGLAFMVSPYHALLLAHQNLRLLSVVVMLRRVNFLIAALIIPFAKDKLVAFMACQMLLNIPVNCWPIWVGLRGQPAAIPRLRDIDKAATKSILHYGGLSFFSGIGNQLRRNGVAVFLNMVFGNSIAAANAIGIRLSGIIQQFLSIFLPVIQPAMTASTGAGTNSVTRRLVTVTSTLCLAVALPLVMPILTDSEPLLQFWLQTEIPQYATIFAQLIALTTLANMLSKGHEMALNATGRIARLVLAYQGCILVFLVFGAVVTYSLNSHPWIIQVAELIGVVVAAGLWQPYWVCKLLGLDIKDWLTQSVRPIVMLTLSCALLACGVCYVFDTSVMRAMLIGTGCGFMSVWTVWQFVFNQHERAAATRSLLALVSKSSS